MSAIAFNSSNKINKSGILFYGKRLYYNNLILQNQENYLDLWYSKPLYGKVDTDLNVVNLSSRYLKKLNSRTLKLSNNRIVQVREKQGDESVRALNFVADAFKAMAAYLRDLEIKGELDKNVFFHPLIAHKGWEGVNKLYNVHTQAQYGLFIRKYLLPNKGKINRQIAGYDDYLPFFNNFLNLSTEQRVPFTKSGFVLNLDCPHSVSGLVIEIAKESDASNDRKKYITYFRKSRQMAMYLEIAKNFGFYVDMNMPWRLVANLESPAWEQNPILKEIVDKYFPKGYTIEKVFNKYYHRPYRSDVQSLKVLTMEYYNSFVKKRPTYKEPKICAAASLTARKAPAGKFVVKTIRRRHMSLGELDLKHDDLFWLRIYMQLRLREMQIDISKHQIKHELREIDQRYTSQGYNLALDYIAQRTAFYLDKQLGKFLSLKEKGKNLLINGQTPDIMF
mgnify:CR=1 FL=1